jgi:hypothetical protein
VPNNLITRRIQNLVILRQNAHDPTDKEWDQCMHLLTSGDGPSNARVLVVTDGGGPNSEQRGRLKLTLDGNNIKVAVVTDHVRTRFIVSSVAFITSKIKSFRRSEMDQAYEYLGLDPTQRRYAERQLFELTEAVGGQSV